ncbi:toxin-antitoxin system HicB family antitoxin [Alicyclobacillus sendaiensis]|uniref:toxin-antitoxin system HicB family antitoxin n=1 Tax=Alicyclobacillus sendaiensis TaxID=192387 RepID=UPI0034CEF0A5
MSHIDITVNSPYTEAVGGEIKVNSPERVQVTVRISKSLDEALAMQAKKLGITKNAYIAMVLSRVPEIQESMKSMKGTIEHEHTA